MSNKIVTISRQFGSGGREVGKRLAEALGVAYYDKELMSMVSEETGFATEFIEKCSESVASTQFAYTFGRAFVRYQHHPEEQVQLAQLKVIRELDKTNGCVIVGRCADYLLKNDNPFKVFVYSSDMGYRVERCFDRVPEDREKGEKEMQKKITSIDKQRAKYYDYYTGKKWGEVENYNLCIDISKVGIKKAVELIVNAMS